MALRVLNLITKLLLLMVFMLAAIAAGIAVDGLHDHIHAAEVGIVLGSKVELNGQPSARLAARLDTALQLYRHGRFRYLIVSGGTGVEGFDEAIVMRNYLVARQVPASAILVDSAGNNTAATMVNSAALMRSHGWHSALIVTQFFHMTRCRLVLRAQSVTQIYSAYADFFEWRDGYSLLRETLALPVYLFLHRS